MMMGAKYIPSGNEFVSLPTVNQRDASVESFTLLHMGYKGMLAFHGAEGSPLISPLIEADGAALPLSGLVWERVESWIPRFEAKAGDIDIDGMFLCPVGHRGFAIRITARNKSTRRKNISIGLTGLWAGVTHCVNEDKKIRGELISYVSNWSGAPVFDLRIGLPVMAFAPMSSLLMAWEHQADEAGVRYNGKYAGVIEPEGERTLDVFWGVGFEEVAAATAAKEQLRHGFDALYDSTATWLSERCQTVGDPRLDEILNLNLFFNYFYSTGYTIDTEEAVMVTSRSPRYYVSAAYWDRDSLLWSFPAILRIDPEYARTLLEYVFTRQIRNVGVHSRYIDGTVLEPGFELDELCAPALALSRYMDATGDRQILPRFEEGLRRILRLLKSKLDPSLGLYETFLQPTDDMRTHPYLTYDNVLAWRMLTDVARMYGFLGDTETLQRLEKEAAELRHAIIRNCIREHEGRRIFAWSIDSAGNWDVYDEPPGSLQLLPALGFCKPDDPVWLNTVDVIRRADYPYSFAGKRFAEIGCVHAPHPWILSVCNSLLCGRTAEAADFLRRAEMDNGIACESVDEYTGLSATGEAFATCAGFLAHSMMTSLNAGEHI
ncbi:MAG: glycoside hydrolase family 125 protein [Oscillospiraceae bacterium]|nr:glycoside hydrolase family 125 protein [Oscillospiraceae bacterium]